MKRIVSILALILGFSASAKAETRWSAIGGTFSTTSIQYSPWTIRVHIPWYHLSRAKTISCQSIHKGSLEGSPITYNKEDPADLDLPIPTFYVGQENNTAILLSPPGFDCSPHTHTNVVPSL